MLSLLWCMPQPWPKKLKPNIQRKGRFFLTMPGTHNLTPSTIGTINQWDSTNKFGNFSSGYFISCVKTWANNMTWAWGAALCKTPSVVGTNKVSQKIGILYILQHSIIWEYGKIMENHTVIKQLICYGPNFCAQNRWCLFSSHGFLMAIPSQTKNCALIILGSLHFKKSPHNIQDLVKHRDVRNSKGIP